jgi:large subunit ribosomal protein L18
MDTLKKKKVRRRRIKLGIRQTISGTTERPRLSVFRSNKEIYAQLIDDSKGITIVAASSMEKGLKIKGKNKIDIAKMVGLKLAEKAKEANVELVVFDRNGYLYHGRVKSLAEGARRWLSILIIKEKL